MSTGSGLGTFNFNTVTKQSCQVVMSVPEEGELKVAHDNYQAVFVVFPSAEEELTAKQHTAVQKLSKETSVHTPISQSGCRTVTA